MCLSVTEGVYVLSVVQRDGYISLNRFGNNITRIKSIILNTANAEKKNAMISINAPAPLFFPTVEKPFIQPLLKYQLIINHSMDTSLVRACYNNISGTCILK